MIHYISTNGIGNAWVANELHAIKGAGIPFVLHAMRGPQQKFFDSDWAVEMNRDTRVLYPLPILGMICSVLLAPMLFGERFFEALANALCGNRESLRARAAAFCHFLVACHWVRGLRHENVTHIHSQWVHSCGSIGMYGAWLLDVPFSFTGHAADLFRERVALVDKVRRADFIVCISTFHREFFKSLGAREGQLHIVYCGIDLTHLMPRERNPQAGERIRILSSGRLVEKKGFADLIDACNILNQKGIDFECTIGGTGPLKDALEEQIRGLGLSERVRLGGMEIKQEELPEFMAGGDIYCLPCVWASDNDVDGLPQMLMEAMACGLPAVSTRLVGIPDLVISEQTGLLVDPHRPDQIAEAIIRLKNDPELAGRLAMAGRARLAEKFDIQTCLEPLIRIYRAKLARTEHGPALCAGTGEQLAASGAR